MSPYDADDARDRALLRRFDWIMRLILLLVSALIVMFFMFFVTGCSPWGGVQAIDKTETKKETTAVKDAVDAASRVTVESSVYPSKVGPATLVVSGSNNHIQLESPKEEAHPNTERKEVVYSANVQLDNSSKSSSALSYFEETKSPWFYLICTVCILVLFVVAEYARRVWLGGISFKNSQAGGIRVFDKMDEVVSDIQGHATNPEVIAEIAKIKRILREKKANLQLKKRDDQ